MNDMVAGSVFSGIGLLDYGLALAGFEHAWFCEADEWRRGILARRWPGVPVHEDVRSIGADTVERVDVIAGGFPCKGASTAGKRTDASSEPRAQPGAHAAGEPADTGRERGELRRGPGRVAGASRCSQEEAPERQRPRDAAGGRGQEVRWGQYAPAIQRWEVIHGPAPEPLVRRVDDRSAARVERSRLSALGDGVQVQIGRIAGEYIVGLERERRMRGAA